MSHVVVLAGGSPHAHDFAATGAALAEVVSAAGHTVEVLDHPDRAAAVLARGSADALAVNGLWWRMLGNAYDPWRDDHAYATGEATQAAFTCFVKHGGGLLAMHTASICFDDWLGWGEILGGAWAWGRSSHPPPGPVAARLITGHPITSGLPEQIDLIDEVYGDLNLQPGIDVLGVARRHADDEEQPVIWTHRFGRGRIVFDGYGHDARSIRNPDHTRLLQRSLSWVLGGS